MLIQFLYYFLGSLFVVDMHELRHFGVGKEEEACVSIWRVGERFEEEQAAGDGMHREFLL